MTSRALKVGKTNGSAWVKDWVLSFVSKLFLMFSEIV